MNKPLRLSDQQQSTILRASYALEPAAQKLLHERVLEELQAVPELGDGVVHRVCRSVQRELWTPPNDALKYRHGPHLFRKLV